MSHSSLKSASKQSNQYFGHAPVFGKLLLRQYFFAILSIIWKALAALNKVAWFSTNLCAEKNCSGNNNSFGSFDGIVKDLNQILLCVRFLPTLDGLKSSFAVRIGKKLSLFQSIRVEHEMESPIHIASLRKSPFYEWLQFFMLIGRKKDGSRSQAQPDGNNGRFRSCKKYEQWTDFKSAAAGLPRLVAEAEKSK